MTDEKLTDLQEQFCREYLVDLNATQAAKRAGYSEQSARQQGSENLSKPAIQERIEALMQERSRRVEVTSDLVLSELLLIAKTDLSRAFDAQGNLLPVPKIPEEIRRAISAVEVTVSALGVATKKVKFLDKIKSLELLGKHLKLFTEKIEHSGTVTLEQLVAGSMGQEKDEA